MASVEGPDFICVGMPKAGTGWLFDQLLQHPEFWMPLVKEIGYLHSDFPVMGNAIRLAQSTEPRSGPRGARYPPDERDRKFLEAARACAGQAMDIGRYVALFHFKGEKLSGDITPGYASLSEERIAAIAAGLPEVKVLVLVRDPIARAWSHVCLQHVNDRFPPELAEDAAGFRAYLQRWRKFQEQSWASKVAERWALAAPAIPFRHFFFDDLEQRPDWTLREILLHIGIDPEKTTSELAADYNRKGDSPKLDLTDTARGVLIEMFADELHACAARFGGHAETWPARYGL